MPALSGSATALNIARLKTGDIRGGFPVEFEGVIVDLAVDCGAGCSRGCVADIVLGWCVAVGETRGLSDGVTYEAASLSRSVRSSSLPSPIHSRSSTSILKKVDGQRASRDVVKWRL